MRKYDSIQWVIDALDNDLIEKKSRENHKTDELRADEDLWWCPKCRMKWNWYEGEVWSSPQTLNYGMLKYVQIAIPLLN